MIKGMARIIRYEYGLLMWELRIAYKKISTTIADPNEIRNIFLFITKRRTHWYIDTYNAHPNNKNETGP